jgi:hypothetical protein
MSLWKPQINFQKINPDANLTTEETQEVWKLSKNSWEELLSEIKKNPNLQKLISKDYAKYNKDILKAYSRYWVNMTSFQQKLVDLWFDLWNYWKQRNWVDWSFWKLTFVAIIKIQKILWLETNWIINLRLLQYLFPRTFRTKNKNEWIWKTSTEVTSNLKEKIDLYDKNEENKKKNIKETQSRTLDIILEPQIIEEKIEEEPTTVKIDKKEESIRGEKVNERQISYENEIHWLKLKIWYLKILKRQRKLSDNWIKELEKLEILLIRLNQKSLDDIKNSKQKNKKISRRKVFERELTKEDYFKKWKELAQFIKDKGYPEWNKW